MFGQAHSRLEGRACFVKQRVAAGFQDGDIEFEGKRQANQKEQQGLWLFLDLSPKVGRESFLIQHQQNDN